MSTWGPIAYAVIAVLLIRASTRAAWHMLRLRDDEEPDWADVTMSLLIGCLITSVWPVWASFALIKRGTGNVSAARFFATVAGESRSERLKRKEREMAEREAHIAKLERELGIKEAA